MSWPRPKRKRKNAKSRSGSEQPQGRAAQTHLVSRNVSRQYMGTMLSFLYRPLGLLERTGTVLGSLCPRILRRPFTVFAAAVFGVITGLLALRFKRPRDRGRRGDPEISDNDRDSVKKAPEEADEESCVVPIGGPAVTGGRAADSRTPGPAAESRNRPKTAEEDGEESRVVNISGLALTGGRAADSRAPGPAAESRNRPKTAEEDGEESRVVNPGGPVVTGGRVADSRAPGPPTESRNRPSTAEEDGEESRVVNPGGPVVTGGWAVASRAPGPATESRNRPSTAEEDGEESRVEHTGGSVVTGERAADSCAPGPAAESRKRPRTTEEEDGEEFDSREYRVEKTDELYCEYDSTWESSPTSKSLRVDRPRVSSYHKFGRFKNAARDMQNYRRDYPQLKSRRQRWNQAYDTPNLDFYLGHRPSSPDSISIHEFHSSEWYGNYDKLERVHTFIQWLFPLQEPGVNYQASELTKEEIEAFLVSDLAKDNLLKSYKLMLDFYGIELCDVKTGEVQRASNWREQFYNLNNNTHNNLRITRILKCLGTLGFGHYQAPLVRFFLKETLVHGALPNVKESVLNYFVFAVLDKTKRRNLIKFAYMNYDRKDEFVWCPKQIQMIWSAKSAKAGFLYPNKMEMKTQYGKGDTNVHDLKSSMDHFPAATTSQTDRRVFASAQVQPSDSIIDFDQQSTSARSSEETDIYQKYEKQVECPPSQEDSQRNIKTDVKSSNKPSAEDSLLIRKDKPAKQDRDESSEDGKPNQKQNLRPTSGSSLGYSSPGPENQMSDDSSHGGAAKPELSLPPTGGGGDHTADNPNSDEEPTEVCHDQINANEVSSAKEIAEEGQSSKGGGSDDESSTDAESDQRL
ncbi:uncharacterized protein LOC139925933 [Centroberyx gerrardi]